MRSIAAQESIRQKTIDFLLMGLSLLLFSIAGALLVSLVATAPHPLFWRSPTQPFPLTSDPEQRTVAGAAATPIVWEQVDYTWTLTPRAHYQMEARVLSKKQYYDWQAGVIPLDLALAWGPMSDPAVDRWISWRQADRWYYYSWEHNSPYSSQTIRDHSANVHIIPASETLASAMKLISVTDVVFLEGLLVDVVAERGDVRRGANTSLTRTDSGAGACEILYVERMVLDGHETR